MTDAQCWEHRGCNIRNGLELCGYIAFCFAYVLAALCAGQGRPECEFGDPFVILVQQVESFWV